MDESDSEKSLDVKNEMETQPVLENDPMKQQQQPDDNEKENLEILSSQTGEIIEENAEEREMVDPEIVSALTNGFLSKILPELEQSKGILEELMRSQQVLIETVEQENSKFDECHSFKELEETMKKARMYHSKLLFIKREMNGLNEKSAKLKKRAVKLQQQKQRDELHRAHKRGKEIEREKMLEAKPARRQQATPPINTDPSPQPQVSTPDT